MSLMSVGTSPVVSFLAHFPERCKSTSEFVMVSSGLWPPQIMVALFHVTATWPALLWGNGSSDSLILNGAAIGVSI